ncbi:NAD(P)-binding protein [Polyplosphaeria fusca]|uniref:NAD(P)-binding protein n=1 Tax=Polyplosphaeria fusca TaxID=682080 RepID=A0A9P4R6S5_9PLEO|nr:NAD(P)-binding protein [Polyplosphaeria fusca]
MANILVTGAAGYIGGSVLTEFASQTTGPIKGSTLHAAVRTDEQVKAVSGPGVNAIQLDFSNQKAVTEAVLNNKIDIVVHTASSMVHSLSEMLLNALSERRKVSGEAVYFIQTGVLTAFADMGGWPYGQVKDSDQDIFEKEKGIGDQHPVRQTNIFIVERSKALGVTSYILPAPSVYGRGTGQWRKLSVSIPQYIRTSMRLRTVYKFPDDGAPPAAHISDLATLYTLLVTSILNHAAPPANEDGYYFPIAHRIPWHATMDLIASAMHARGLVDSPAARVWPSYERAADELGLPRLYVRAMGTSTGDIVAEKPFALGWRPEWDEEAKFLGAIEQEVRDVLEVDTVKPTVFAAIMD